MSSYRCYVNCLHNLDISGPLWTRVDQLGTRWGPAVPLDRCEPLWTIVDQSGPATVMAEIVDEGTIVDQRDRRILILVDHCGPEWTRREQGDARDKRAHVDVQLGTRRCDRFNNVG